MTTAKRLPARAKTKEQDTWDLSSLTESDMSWEQEFSRFQRQATGYAKFRGKLGRSAKDLADCLRFDSRLERLAERIGTYAFLRTTEDQTNSDYQRMMGRFQNAATRASEAASFIRPELLSISNSRIRKFLKSREMQPFALGVERLLRFKPHTLGDKEEQLLAMQGEMSQASRNIFRQLLDADMKFGLIKDENGRQIELSNATFMQLLHSPKRSVRRTAFHQYYDQFRGHENTLSAALSGSVQTDIYYARARGYDGALAAALFPDKVPESVYSGLIATVRERLPALYRYYDLRRRKMRLREIHHYDTYVPILAELDTRRTWKQASKTIISALEPLGSPYCEILERGLNGRWCDRYPNAGKQSGAFSCGTFDGDPYILMNYKPEVLDDMFTLAHEAGHSMHSYFSAKTQPFEYYDYTIFVAEVASTFNEQLLSHYLMENAKSDQERAYLINRDIDAIRGTIIRQTMFAEYEKVIHEMAEQGEPLTCQSAKDQYHKLLDVYFGPDFALDADLALEGLRIPHFYRAFYVYKYATGLSAAIALSQRVLNGGKRELNDYLGFLKGGCSKYPLDLLRDAGVDMEDPQPVKTALDHFERLVKELDELL
jgi:oligoendopeptidase F